MGQVFVKASRHAKAYTRNRPGFSSFGKTPSPATVLKRKGSKLTRSALVGPAPLKERKLRALLDLTAHRASLAIHSGGSQKQINRLNKHFNKVRSLFNK